MEQQRPRTCSGMPARPARRRWFQSCMVRPTTLWPSARSMAATVDESTPPDIATAIVSAGMGYGCSQSGSVFIHYREFARERATALPIWLEDQVGRSRTCFLRAQNDTPASTPKEERIWSAQ